MPDCPRCRELEKERDIYLDAMRDTSTEDYIRTKSRNKQLVEALKEAKAEIVYWHNNMLTPEERAHPRGSGWARVYDNIDTLLKENGDG